MNRNDLITIAQRLREYVGNPHHVDPMSDAFKMLIGEASEALSRAAQPQGVPSEVIAFGIQVEKLLCAALDREWSASSISIESLVSELKGKPRGEPVAWLGSGVPFARQQDAIEYASYKDKHVTPLYAEQPAPVVDPLDKGFTTLESDCGKYKIVTSFATRDDAWSAYRALVGAKPAPVAVTLSADELRFLEAIALNPGAKLNGGIAWNEEGDSMWGRLENLGLIKCVGGYKWKLAFNAVELGVKAFLGNAAPAQTPHPAHANQPPGTPRDNDGLDEWRKS